MNLDNYRYVIRKADGFYWTGKVWNANASTARRYKKLPATLDGGKYKLMGDQSDRKSLYYLEKVTGAKILVQRTRATDKDK